MSSYPSPAVGHWLNEFEQRHPEDGATIDRFRSLLQNHSNAFERDCWAGHITGAAWLLSPSLDRVLMTHHRKLDRWLQLGGHSDGDPDPLAVARREAEEESGLEVAPLGPGLLDIDIHSIPARKSDPEHLHFDLRFAFVSTSGSDYQVSEESHELAWVDLVDFERFTHEPSLRRMAGRWRGWIARGLHRTSAPLSSSMC